MHISIANFSQMVKGKTFLLPTNIKSHMAFRLAYLHLTLAYFKGQGPVESGMLAIDNWI